MQKSTPDSVFVHNNPDFIEKPSSNMEFPLLKCHCGGPISWYYEYDWDKAFVRCDKHRIKR